MAKMPYRRLGQAGMKVSALGLGGWTTYGGSVRDADLVRTIIRRAYDKGVTFFDIADVYAKGESERIMGETLRDMPRHTLVISSKLFWPMSDDPNDRGLSRKHIMESIEKSLRRIGTDYLDIYFCHRSDPETPIDETLRAMDDLIRQGKILYWGTSEWSGAELRQVHARAEARGLDGPAVEQPQLSLLSRKRFQEDVGPAAREVGMGLVTWSPLASGMLSGKYDQGLPKDSRFARIDWLKEQLLTDQNRDRVKQMKTLADEHGTSRAALAIAWTLAQPGVSSVITGATRVDQLDENLKALDVEVTADLGAKLEELFPVGA